LVILDKADVLIANNVNLSDHLAEMLLIKGYAYKHSGDFSQAEKFMLQAIDSALIHNPLALGYYQRELINLYSISENYDKAIKISREWIERQHGAHDEWIPLTDNIHYMMAWLLIDTHPSEASLHLKQVDSPLATEKIELILAQGLIDEYLGNKMAVDAKTLQVLVDAVDDYGWEYLTSYIKRADNKKDAIDNWDRLAINWYRKIETILLRPEYDVVFKAIQHYSERSQRVE